MSNITFQHAMFQSIFIFLTVAILFHVQQKDFSKTCTYFT